MGAGGIGGVAGFKLSRASKESAKGGLGAPGIPAGGGTGTTGFGICDETGGVGTEGAPPGLSPGAVTDGIFPEISASKIPAAGTGLGEAEMGATGWGATGGKTGIPADGGFAPTVNPAIGGKGGRAEPADVMSPKGGFAPTVNPAMGGRTVIGTDGVIPAGVTAEVLIEAVVPKEAGPVIVLLITGEPDIVGAETSVDFFVENVKINLVPISAFSATAVPP